MVVRELNTSQFLGELPALTVIYARAMAAPAAQLPGRGAIMRRHAGYPAFTAVVAELPSSGAGPIAFAYGFHGIPGQWWYDVVHSALTAALGDPGGRYWVADSFEVAEVHVDPEHQGRGIGRALMHTLAAGCAQRTALLSTHDGPTRARRLYHSLGFTDLLRPFTFPGTGQPYAIMGVTLPLRDSPSSGVTPSPRAHRPSPSRW